MNILYVHECFGPLGGAEANVIITARELAKKGHKVGVVFERQTDDKSGEWANVFENRYQHAGDNDFQSCLNYINDFKPDVIYVHKNTQIELLDYITQSNYPSIRMVHDHDMYCMRSYKYNPLSRVPCESAFGIKCATSCLGTVVRNKDSKYFPIKFKSYSNMKRELQTNRKFDSYFVVTDFMKGELVKNGFEENRIFKMPPVPVQKKEQIRANFSDKNRIVYAGQIIRGKGVDYLLKALSTIDIPFEAIILGDGNHRSACEKLSHKLGLTDKVQFAGFVNQSQLKSYYEEASVAAISSVWPEPIATVGLEVMRYGLPVVAFDVGGISDWLMHGINGYMAPLFDYKDMGGHMKRLLLDKDLAKKLGNHGQQISNKTYNFDAYISEMENKFSVMSENQVSIAS